MPLKLHNLKTNRHKTRQRRGRGNATGSGNYSGRGMKGQKSRSGGRHKGRHAGKKFPAFIAQIPKKRGFRSIHPQKIVVNIEDINKEFKSGETVDVKKLKEAGLITQTHPGVKILGRGKMSKKLTVTADSFSKSAFDAIKKAGGEPIIIEKPKKK